MYYVFFETGNDAFFSNIADAFCSILVQSIVDGYAQIDASRSAVPTVDLEYIQNELDIHRKICMPLSCTFFPSIYCGNQECANSKIALTSNQLDKFEVSMTHTNHAFFEAKNFPENPKARLSIQRILQSYRLMNMQGVEHIPGKNKQNHNEYLRSYITGTNKMKDKAEGFVYVRAKTDSDYDYFKINTELPNVMACDNFQQI